MPIRERIEEALREVGVLLVALAPLDAGLTADRSVPVFRMLCFIAAGVAFFLGALYSERRRRRG